MQFNSVTRYWSKNVAQMFPKIAQIDATSFFKVILFKIAQEAGMFLVYFCKQIFFFLKWAKPGLFLLIFILFSHHMDKYSTNLTINEKSIDGMLGSQTQGSRMEGADESTELWQHPFVSKFVTKNFKKSPNLWPIL